MGAAFKLSNLAGKRGIEPRTERLTAVCSTSELYAKIHPTVTLHSFRWQLSSRTFNVVAEYTFILELPRRVELRFLG